MVMVCFFGMKKDGFSVGRAVLPKFLLQDVGLEGFEVMRKGGGGRIRRVICVSFMPRIMVEAFLKDHLEVDVVVGRELKTIGGYYSGIMVEEIKVVQELLNNGQLQLNDDDEISPIEVVALSRDREKDRKKMEELLRQGKQVVVAPEGTTCREPYLLRFSRLFAELSDEIVPVALKLHVGMFYATTAAGMKALDPIFFALNPCACYELEFLEKMDTRGVRRGKSSSIDMANQVQRVLARALGFECTMFTRKDKYMFLAVAGNDGLVL